MNTKRKIFTGNYENVDGKCDAEVSTKTSDINANHKNNLQTLDNS